MSSEVVNGSGQPLGQGPSEAAKIEAASMQSNTPETQATGPVAGMMNEVAQDKAPEVKWPKQHSPEEVAAMMVAAEEEQVAARRQSLDDPRLKGIGEAPIIQFTGTDRMLALHTPTMIVEDVMPSQTIMGITAESGVGKTWFVFELLRALATGDPFLKHFPVSKSHMNVLFVGDDASIYDYARMWRRLVRGQWGDYQEQVYDGRRGNNPLDERVKFLIQSGFLFEDLNKICSLIRSMNEFEPLATPEAVEEVAGYEIEHELSEEQEEGTNVGTVSRVNNRKGMDLIVFDTLTAQTRKNGNDHKEITEVFSNIRFLAEQTGAAVLILHHNPRRSEFNSGNEWRGAGIASLDTHLQLNKATKKQVAVGVPVNLVRAEWQKFRGIKPKDFAFIRDTDNKIDGMPDDAVEARLYWVEHPSEGTEQVTEPDMRKVVDATPKSIVDIIRSITTRDPEFSTSNVVSGIIAYGLIAHVESEDEKATRARATDLFTNETRRLTKKDAELQIVRVKKGVWRVVDSAPSAGAVIEAGMAADPSLNGADDE